MTKKRFKSYEDCKINIVYKTPTPDWTCVAASNLTQKKNYAVYNSPEKKERLVKYLLKANHTSIFEHCYITVIISNVSRSFLAQITRHRMGSFTSASQHYQEYDEYPNILHPNMVDNLDAKRILDDLDMYYKSLINRGIPKEEARQILPNAKAVNIMWTVNARSLINFLNLRMCERNVTEMLLFAKAMSTIAKGWWPNLFNLVGPDCFMTGNCKQGRMACDNQSKNLKK